MIKAVKIELRRGEGWERRETQRECTGENPWRDASNTLFNWSITAPKDGSYHKVSFKVTYEDDSVYEGRYDLHHHTVEAPNLERHIRAFCETHALRKKPVSMSDENWERFKTYHQHEKAATFGELLDKYEIGR